MIKIRIKNTVFDVDAFGNRFEKIPAGLHDDTPDTRRQIALQNGEEVDVEEPAAEALADAPAAEAAPAPAPAAKAKKTA